MNTKESIKERVSEMVREIIETQAEIVSQASLVLELDMDSLDLLELTFSIEEAFGVSIGANELRGKAKAQIPEEDIVDENGNLSPEALEALKSNIPEISPDRFVYGLRQEDIPKLLNVDVFVRIIHDKLNPSPS